MAEGDKLTPQQFAAKIRTKYPGAYDSVSDDDLTSKIIAKYPEYGEHVSAPAAAPPPAQRPLPDPFKLPGNMSQGVDLSNQPDTGEGTMNLLPAAGGAVGGALGGPPGAALGGIAGEGLKQIGHHSDNPPLEMLKEGGLQGAFEGGGKALSFVGGKLSDVASQSLARILRLSPKAFQFGREPAQEVLEQGIAGNSLPKLVENIGQASKETTAQLNSVLKGAKGAVDAENLAIGVANGIPGTAGNRFLKVVDDAAGKLGFKDLKNLTASDLNALKQEVARQGKFVEGDLRASVSGAIKQFGGQSKDALVKLAPEAAPLLETSANLTEASKAGDYAIRMEKAGRGKGPLADVEANRPSTYLRPVTDSTFGAKTLFKVANALKDSTGTANALRIAFQFVYPGANEDPTL